MSNALKFLQKNGLQVIACTEKATQSIYEIDFTFPTVILVGSEENGIRSELLSIADQQATIPMIGRIASLNVSVAASICLFEALRQRGGKHS